MNSHTDNTPLEEKKPLVVIYCKGWCDYLRELVQLLHEKNYTFTFTDLRFDTQKAKNLVARLGNPLILPVIYINDQYYERPPLLEVNEAFDLSFLPVET
jgi:glutaredoxin